MKLPLPMNDAGLRVLVEQFYATVRADDLIGSLFSDAIVDWPHHLNKLTDFWSSVMLSSGRYKGQPVPAHRKHQSRIRPEMFERWLVLWKAATDRLMEPADAMLLQDKAARIAESLSLALFFRLDRSSSEKAA